MSRKSHLLFICFFSFMIAFINYNISYAQRPSIILPFADIFDWQITSGYNSLPTHIQRDSTALDFTAEGCLSWDKPILAMAAGYVEIAPYQENAYGNHLYVNHGGGYRSHYAHLNSISVSDGQFVDQGQEIGRCGNTGFTRGEECEDYPGTHIHVTFEYNQAPIRPEPMSGYIGLEEDQWYGIASTAIGIEPDQGSYYPGQTVIGRFSVTNYGERDLAIETLTISGRGPNGVQDFEYWNTVPILGQNETANYEGSLTLSETGEYKFVAAYKIDGLWYNLATDQGQLNSITIYVSPLSITLTPPFPPVTLPGGSLSLSARVENLTDEDQGTEAWIETTYPNGTDHFLFGQSLYIPPFSFLTRDITFIVPEFAPLGNYTVTGNVGDYNSNMVWDSDSFDIQVVAELNEWIEDFSNFDPAGFYIDGMAYYDSYNEYFVLTNNSNYQTGRLFNLEAMMISTFSADFTFRIGGGDGADGITFAFCQSYDYPPAAGGSLDFWNANGFAIELDTYYNSGSDPSEEHIGIVQDFANNHLFTLAVSDGEIEDNNYHQLSVLFDEGYLTVSLDGEPRFDYTIPNFEPFLGYFGFTAATGNDNNYHIIDNIDIISY